MKKAFIISIAIILIAAVAYAEVSLSSMSYEELIELNHQLTAEIMSRPEWKEVTVPSGTWVVGSDIPAGTYSVHSGNNGGGYFAAKDKSENYIAYGGIRDDSDTIGKIELKDGYVVEISSGSVVFAPPISLGF